MKLFPFSAIFFFSSLFFCSASSAASLCQRYKSNDLIYTKIGGMTFEAYLKLSGKEVIDCESYDSGTGTYTCEGIKINADRITTVDGETLRFPMKGFKMWNSCKENGNRFRIVTYRYWRGKIPETDYSLQFKSAIYQDYKSETPEF